MEDLKAYFAHIAIMGVVKKPRIEDYWASHPFTRTPFFGTKMARNRFQDIGSHIHFNDVRNMPSKEEDDFDPLYRVRPLVDMCKRNFKRALQPEMEISVDEATCPWKGKVSFKCYNPSKPNKYHMKYYAVCESASGYIMDFIIHTGEELCTAAEEITLDPEANKTTKLVMFLLHTAGLLDKGHHIYMDNWYSSPELFDELFSRDTYSCGTVRATRKGLPKAVSSVQNKDFKKCPGQTIWRRNGPLLALKWMDKKMVYMITTIHDAVQVDVKINFRGDIVSKPEAVADYNKFMLGVDLSDQLSVYYAYDRRTRKWTRKLMYNLFDKILTNAYVLYKKFYDRKIAALADEQEKKNAQRRLLLHRPFVLSIVSYLLNEPNYQERSDSNPNVSVSSFPGLEARRLTERHFPTLIQSDRCKKRKTPSRPCFLCKLRASSDPATNKQHYSTFECSSCQKTLCVGERQCFMLYHTEKELVPNDVSEAEENYDTQHEAAVRVTNELDLQDVEAFLATM